MLLRVLRAEFLKTKRTLALWMVAGAPVIVVVLLILILWQLPSTLMFRRGTLWRELANSALGFWAMLMMPLLVALQTALLAGFDHEGNQWKNLFALPVPRWTFYIGKLLLASVMLAVSGFVLACGIAFAGSILPHIQPELRFTAKVPWPDIFERTAQVVGLAFPSLAIQHWLSLRWRSFSAALGVGIAAVVVSVVLVSVKGGWEQYYPWAMPVRVLSNRPFNAAELLWTSLIIGIAIVIAGCWDFCRRDVA